MAERNVVEKRDDDEEQHKLENRHLTHILRAQYVGLIMTIINIFIHSIAAGTDQEKISLIFSTSNLLNILSFAVLMWRFHTRLSPVAPAGMTTLLLTKRDKHALNALAVIFLLSSFLIIFDAIYTISFMILPSTGLFYILFDAGSFVAFLLLSVWNLLVARKTKMSRCVAAACLVSTVSAVSSLSSAVSMVVYMADPFLWYTNEITSFLIGFILAAYAVKIIFTVHYSQENKNSNQ